MPDPYLSEYIICRLGKSGMIEGEPLILSAEEACQRDPAKFFKFAAEVDKAWKAYYREEQARQAQLPLLKVDA